MRGRKTDTKSGSTQQLLTLIQAMQPTDVTAMWDEETTTKYRCAVTAQITLSLQHMQGRFQKWWECLYFKTTTKANTKIHTSFWRIIITSSSRVFRALMVTLLTWFFTPSQPLRFLYHGELMVTVRWILQNGVKAWRVAHIYYGHNIRWILQNGVKAWLVAHM